MFHLPHIVGIPFGIHVYIYPDYCFLISCIPNFLGQYHMSPSMGASVESHPETIFFAAENSLDYPTMSPSLRGFTPFIVA